MVRSVINPSLHQTIIFLFCVCFQPILSSSISTTISHAHHIHLGNETDRLALLAIKEKLYDPLQAMSSWNESTHFCEWEGVLCSRRHQRVVKLDLRSRGLVGSVSPYIGNLSFLRVISLRDNNFQGNIPQELSHLFRLKALNLQNNSFVGKISESIGRDCPNLIEVYLGGNQFSGILPVSLFTNASQLSILDVKRNNFVGQVPKDVGHLKEIRYLELSENHFGSGGKSDDLGFITSLSNCSNLVKLSIHVNRFGGRLPASLTNLSVTLKFLYVHENQIFGSIPSDMSRLKNLVALNASKNFLTGTIPKDIGMLQKLQYMGLGDNSLTGKIPSTIGNLTSLYWLSLSYNMLQGNVEPSLAKCLFLQKLEMNNNSLAGNLPKQILGLYKSLLAVDLSNNYLIGSLPQEMGNFKNLVHLNLSGNQLSGEIPTTLGSCCSLEELYLAGNSFQGHIPFDFRDLVAIKFIDLSQNNLSGKIPRNLENLRNLIYFNISFNDFEGEVPVKGIFQNVTRFSMLENDKLCGGISILKLPKCHIQKSKKKFPMPLKVTVGVLVSLSVIVTLFMLVALHLRKKSSAKSICRKYVNALQRISYNEIREATNGFSSSNLIGTGSFASVYKGVLRECGSVIAVKVFNLMERGASKSFKDECEILRNIRHRNLLKILTVCSSTDFDGNDFKALILEFMPYGSLEDWLHPSSDTSQRMPRILNLLQRLNIAIDVASALDYLHNCNHTPIVHCDLKPSNVLLTEDLVACVGDFGLAKFLSQSHRSLDKSEINSNAVQGTVGYIPPEYGMGSEVSTKGDVYSYGIMLLEMFTGRRPTDEMFGDNLSLHNFCKVNLAEKDVDMLTIIPLMELPQNDKEEERSMTSSMKKCLLSVIEIGVVCSLDAVDDRMQIKDALMKIKKIKEVFLNSMNPGGNTNMDLHI